MISDTAHRPWPLPQQLWVMRMDWHDMLFMHWPINSDALRRYIPPTLPIDTFDGSAWKCRTALLKAGRANCVSLKRHKNIAPVGYLRAILAGSSAKGDQRVNAWGKRSAYTNDRAA